MVLGGKQTNAILKFIKKMILGEKQANDIGSLWDQIKIMGLTDTLKQESGNKI